MKRVNWQDKLVSTSSAHMTDLSRHAATNRSLPRGTNPNCLLAYRASREEDGRNPVCACSVCLRVSHACKQWMAALSVGEQLRMLFVFFGGQVVHVVSVLWRAVGILPSLHPPCVFVWAFVTVKRRWSNEIINTLEFCQPHMVTLQLDKSCSLLLFANHLTS